jgi:hypothetical protein
VPVLTHLLIPIDYGRSGVDCRHDYAEKHATKSPLDYPLPTATASFLHDHVIVVASLQILILPGRKTRRLIQIFGHDWLRAWEMI